MTCGRCGYCTCLTARIKRRLGIEKMPYPLSHDEYSADMAYRAVEVLARRAYDGSPILEIAHKRVIFALDSYKRAKELNLPTEGAMIFLEKAVHLYLSEVEGKDPAKEKW